MVAHNRVGTAGESLRCCDHELDSASSGAGDPREFLSRECTVGSLVLENWGGSSGRMDGRGQRQGSLGIRLLQTKDGAGASAGLGGPTS